MLSDMEWIVFSIMGKRKSSNQKASSKTKSCSGKKEKFPKTSKKTQKSCWQGLAMFPLSEKSTKASKKPVKSHNSSNKQKDNHKWEEAHQ